MKSRKVYLGKINMNSMHGQDFAYAGRTDRPTDDVRYNIIRSKAPSGYKIHFVTRIVTIILPKVVFCVGFLI